MTATITPAVEIIETTVDGDRAWKYTNGDDFYDLVVMFAITPAGEKIAILVNTYNTECFGRWVTYTESGMGTLSADELGGFEWISRSQARKVDARIRAAYS